ncbi:NAD-dependent epimerase/dehydratase family protein [Roseococcus sp. YIM B11640]|uniref:NAD-dependent epimerase/dehydratase family protein n=1 Tax=Roseococcus sp. YIM B11640 TaxID=3133973 RepID=UPI003C7E93BF
MTAPTKPVLLTGASGNLGRQLAKGLSALGWKLRLTDITPFPDPLPDGASFVKADLGEGLAIVRQAEGCGAILHFGGVSVERPFEEILGPNLRGLYHIYEAARREGARVVFASSNHAIGFHERPQGNQDKLDFDCEFRPDGYYGLAKAYGELMGRMYWDKHGVENVNLRIGSSFPKPVDRRMLSTWLSFGDLTRLVERCVVAERVGHAVIWGSSANPSSFWGRDHRERIGWAPQDSSEPFRPEVEHITADPVTERYQGGGYTLIEYSRSVPSPRNAFTLED